MASYDHKKIEKKWQKEWAKNDFAGWRAENFSTKQKKYVLDMFPYPSGDGLHVGHLVGYIGSDILSRYFRMNGFNVLHPMGWDAFGLPAENYAIKNKIHPRVAVEKNIKNFKRQSNSIGFSYDWQKAINTTDPDYYKWTQWIFLQLFKKGLAYEADLPVNWCVSCKTVLANEEVKNGVCDRCGSQVLQKNMRQWALKITAYADRLLDDLDDLDWPESIKEMQRNWIGKSDGAEIKFPISNSQFSINVFTTRPDTLFGATYMVLAPEHPLIEMLKSKIKNWVNVEQYIKEAKKKTQLQRQKEEKDKTGVELKWIKAINPANNEEIPIWVADYVLMNYGAGAIMAVPAHDQRDFEFAKKFRLSIKCVVIPSVVDHINPPRPDKLSKTRKNVHALVYDPIKKKYLIIRNKKFGWDTVVIGGVEDGETPVEAALRELKEETGYVDLEFKRILGWPVQATYFAKHKDENRIAITTAIYFELKSSKRVPVAEDEENDGNEILWVDASHCVPGKMVNSELPYWLSRLSQDEDFAYTAEGTLINSGKFDGIDSEKAKNEIIKFVRGETKTQYRLRDWIFSRQRYWGEPIPIIKCPKCGNIAVSENDLPVKLPDVKNYKPTGTGESPLASVAEWVNVNCPKCGGQAKRETNTMPQWAGSCWYYMGYVLSNKLGAENKKDFWNEKILKYWLPVDLYIGGVEHAVLHLLYARFWHKFLYGIGVVSIKEPFQKLINQGLVLGPDGQKMSKSRGNVIGPDEMIEKFGADALRMYEMFMSPFGDQKPWDPRGIIGLKRFLDRVWGLALLYPFDDAGKKNTGNNVILQTNTNHNLHGTIQGVSEDIDNFKFNTAISKLMILLGYLEACPDKSAFVEFLKLLAPFAPHMTEEIWHKFGSKKSIHLEKWPDANPQFLIEKEFDLIVQVNGKVRDKFKASIHITQEQAEALTLSREKVKLLLENKKLREVVFIPKRLINLVV